MEDESEIVKRQQQFITWMKERGIYNPIYSARDMRLMHMIWEENHKQLQEQKMEFINGTWPKINLAPPTACADKNKHEFTNHLNKITNQNLEKENE